MYQPAQELSLHNAVDAAQAGMTAIVAGITEFDLSSLKTVDSAAIVVMLNWQREAGKLGKTIVFHGVPPSIASLLALYDVSELLHIAQA
jgi:phospholipid transport system transporter-binding protein